MYGSQLAPSSYGYAPNQYQLVGAQADQLIPQQLGGASSTMKRVMRVAWYCVGISVAAIDPDVPAERYSVDNLLLRELRFERDIVDVGAGIILRLTPTTELNAGYQRTLWGRNTSVVDGFNLSFAMRASLLPGT